MVEAIEKQLVHPLDANDITVRRLVSPGAGERFPAKAGILRIASIIQNCHAVKTHSVSDKRRKLFPRAQQIIQKRPVVVCRVDFISGAALAHGKVKGFFPMGMHRGKWQDKIIRRICYLLSSVPAFWLGLILLLLFSVKLGWFPVGFSTPIGMLDSEVGIWQRLYHLALPALTLTLVSFSSIALHTRQKMIDVMNSAYVLFARARGEGGWTLFVRHGLRNTILPALTLQFASFAELFGGSVLAENVFSYPGLGSAVSAAGLGSDVPLLLGITLFSTLFVCAGNMAANLLYGIVDPQMH